MLIKHLFFDLNRAGYHVLSAITAAGELTFDIEEKSIDGKRSPFKVAT
jgi:hypothetical protein